MTDSARKYLDIVKHIVKEGQGQIADDERALLNRQRDLLQLSPREAEAIEHRVLRAYQTFLERSQSYGQGFQASEWSSAEVAQGSQRIASVAGDSNDSTNQDARPSDPDYLDRIERYKQDFAQAMRQQYPLEDSARSELTALQRSLDLRDRDVQQAEAEVLIEQHDVQEAQHEKQRWYEEEFTRATDANLLSDEATQDRLWQLQTDLNLSPDDVTRIEQQVLSSRQNQPDRFSANQNSANQNLDDLAFLNAPYDDAAYADPSAPTQLNLGYPPDDEDEIDPTLAPTLAPTELRPPQSRLPLQRSLETLPEHYAELVQYLQTQDWKQADRATLAIMLKAAQREAQGWLNSTAIEQLPCGDLQQLDRLWGEYSNEQFSFRIQWRLYSTLALPQQNALQLHHATYERALTFSKKVGWWRSGSEFYKYYNQLTFSREALDGHLPALWYWQIPWWRALRFGGIGPNRGGCSVDEHLLSVFMKKLQNCDIT